MSALVVDASVALKWFLPEVHADAALRLLDRDHHLMAPELVVPEFGNALWKRVLRGEASAAEAGAALEALATMPVVLQPSQPLAPLALDIACRTRRTVYDSLYVALAVVHDCRLVTADRRLYQALTDSALAVHLLWIEDA